MAQWANEQSRAELSRLPIPIRDHQSRGVALLPIHSQFPGCRRPAHWDLDHPFERLLVDTAVAPDPSAVSWINPRLRSGEMRQVVTGIPGKTGVVYTLDRATGEFLWATPTVTQNVITHIDGATGAVSENAEVVFTALGQEVSRVRRGTAARTVISRGLPESA